ncbi:MAG: hypothetical protein AB1540_03010, partial [Bdellovibrionota bacterium]
VMTGMPGETDETAMETGRFLGDMARMQGTPPAELGMGAFYALPLPGTPLYQYGQQVGMIGRTVDEEEKYLEAISDCPSNKTNYINLNGASLKTALFWDILIMCEATRTYFAKPLGNDFIRHIGMNFERGKIDNTVHGEQNEAEFNEAKYQISKHYPAMGSVAYREFLKTRDGNGVKQLLDSLSFLKTIRFYLALILTRWATIINTKLATSPVAQKIPRWILYPVMRNMNYLQFVIWGLVRKAIEMTGRRVKSRSLFNYSIFPKPITSEFLSGFQHRIERSLRNVVAINRDNSFRPQSSSEFNQDLLNQGR